MPCEGRHHEWDETQTPPVCKKCGEPKKGPGRPKGSKTKKVAGPAVAGRLAATLGVAAPAPRAPGMENTASPAVAGAPPPAASPPGAAAGPTPSPGAPTVAPGSEKADPGRSAPPLRPKGWQKSAGRKLARVFDSACDWIGEEVFRRELNDPDEEDMKEFAEGIAEQLGVWFPDAEFGPWGKIILAGTFIVTEKSIGSTKLPPKPKPGEAIAAAKPAPPTPPLPGKVLQLQPPAAPPAASAPAADTTRAETNPQPSPT